MVRQKLYIAVPAITSGLVVANLMLKSKSPLDENITVGGFSFIAIFMTLFITHTILTKPDAAIIIRPLKYFAIFSIFTGCLILIDATLAIKYAGVESAFEKNNHLWELVVGTGFLIPGFIFRLRKTASKDPFSKFKLIFLSTFFFAISFIAIFLWFLMIKFKQIIIIKYIFS